MKKILGERYKEGDFQVGDMIVLNKKLIGVISSAYPPSHVQGVERFRLDTNIRVEPKYDGVTEYWKKNVDYEISFDKRYGGVDLKGVLDKEYFLGMNDGISPLFYKDRTEHHSIFGGYKAGRYRDNLEVDIYTKYSSLPSDTKISQYFKKKYNPTKENLKNPTLKSEENLNTCRYCEKVIPNHETFCYDHLKSHEESLKKRYEHKEEKKREFSNGVISLVVIAIIIPFALIILTDATGISCNTSHPDFRH